MKNKKKKVILVAGARPNFMKIAPVIIQMRKSRYLEPALVHVGQHYDQSMSGVFFEDLSIERPRVNLNVGSGSHAVQTAEAMKRFEEFILNEKPDLVVVVGDVNSTLAASLVAAKLNIKIAHIEAGLRSFDRSMPEEINRVITDAISDLLFTTSRDADINLIKEGIAKEKIHFVGNVMIDTLMRFKEKSRRSSILENSGLVKKQYAVLTLHRPSNVDDREVFRNIFQALDVISTKINIVFPCHPRTSKKIHDLKLKNFGGAFKVFAPLGYLDFFKLMNESSFVLTDSGGIQEETSILDIPCLTLRANTERPVTVKLGTNKVIGNKKETIISEVENILRGKRKHARPIPLWDGKASERIVRVLEEKYGNL
jgi:UDP-N-acetylglucosamine 2-epimerase (non-hydrolysing)